MNEDNTYVESATWIISGDQLTINTPDTILNLTIPYIGKSNLSLSLNLTESINDMGAIINYDITQVINSAR